METPLEFFVRKLAKDEATLKRVQDHPDCSEWYKEHLKARIAFDKRTIEEIEAKDGSTTRKVK